MGLSYCRPFKRHRTDVAVDAAVRKHTDPDEILEVFAAFYESLYSTMSAEPHVPDTTSQSKAVTSKEVADALCRMKVGRACGDYGLYVEMLRTQRQGLIDTICDNLH